MSKPTEVTARQTQRSNDFTKGYKAGMKAGWRDALEEAGNEIHAIDDDERIMAVFDRLIERGPK